MEELEEISRRCNEAALDAERIKDKELLRARRAREVSAMFVNIGVCLNMFIIACMYVYV